MEKEIVLITGASSGFGYLTALHLAKKGYYVVATMRDMGKKEMLLEAANSQNTRDNLEVLQLDVNNEARIEIVKNHIDSRYGKLDILINNAGYCLGGMTEHAIISEWEHQFRTNVVSVIQLTQAFIPIMRNQRKGKIINIGSISGRFGFPGLGAYTTSKFALSGFSESLRLELAPFQISVSLVEPGSFKTGIWDKSLEQVTRIDDSDYKHYMDFIYQEAKNSAHQAEDPIKVVRLIEKICGSKKPRFRYPVGRGVKFMIFMKTVVPWSMIESVFLKKLSKNKKD